MRGDDNDGGSGIISASFSIGSSILFSGCWVAASAGVSSSSKSKVNTFAIPRTFFDKLVESLVGLLSSGGRVGERGGGDMTPNACRVDELAVGVVGGLAVTLFPRSGPRVKLFLGDLLAIPILVRLGDREFTPDAWSPPLNDMLLRLPVAEYEFT